MINLRNLKKIFNHILKDVPQKMITMRIYRAGDEKIPECKSVGCIIGHSIILDDWENIPKCSNGDIKFTHWSREFTGLKYNSKEWQWCFSSFWPNNKAQILLRLKYLIDNKKVPKQWYFDFGYKLPVEKLELFKIQTNGNQLLKSKKDV